MAQNKFIAGRRAHEITMYKAKDGKTWNADVKWSDGSVWTAWQSGFKAMKALREHIKTVTSTAKIVRA